MATMPAEDEAPQPVRERVARAVERAASPSRRPLALLAVAAGAGSLAPDPFGLIVAMTCVIAASDLAKRR